MSESKDKLYLKVKYFTHLLKPNRLQKIDVKRNQTFIIEVVYVHFNDITCHTDHHIKIFIFLLNNSETHIL